MGKVLTGGDIKVRVNTAGYGAKFYLNGFPKAGLHLLDLMVRPIAMPMVPDDFNAPWVSMFGGNSWTTQRVPIEQITYRLGRVQPGYFLKGHLGYDPEINLFLNRLGALHLFIYRDFRDVAVSQTYHILSDNVEGLGHEGRDMIIKRFGRDFDSVLEAVISGVGQYPGVMERWQLYKRWLKQDWVLCLRFEDLRSNPNIWALEILNYTMARLAQIFSLVHAKQPAGYKQVAAEMVRTSRQTQVSPTFRKGNVGDWRDHFNDKHIKLFKASDKAGDLARLNYEKDGNW